jgi:hypothetical protein
MSGPESRQDDQILAVAREHALGRLQFAELAGKLFVLSVGAREHLADPLLFFLQSRPVDILCFEAE